MKKVKLIELIKSTKLSVLSIFSFGVPLAVLAIWGSVSRGISYNNTLRIIDYLFYFICIFLFGTIGLFQVIKKEAPGIGGKPIKGFWAIVSGVLIMLIFWGLNVLLVYYYFLSNIESQS